MPTIIPLSDRGDAKHTNTISVLKHRFKTEDAYRVRKSAHVRICSLMRFRTVYDLFNGSVELW